MRHFMHKRWRARVAALLSLLLAFQPLALANTDIADTPMAVTNTVKPNIMLTIDSSGGMDVDMLVKTYNSMYYESGVTPGGNPNLLNGFFYIFPLPAHGGTTGGGLATYLMGDSSNPDPLHWRARDYQYNSQYYDPFVTYSPWPGVDKNGTAYANATPTAARIDPYDPTAGTLDLTQSIANVTAYTYLDPCGVDISKASHVCNGTTYGPGERAYTTTITPASYWYWTDSNGNGQMDAGEGVRYDINASTLSYPSGRSYSAELQNFANWFQYYRTPMLSLKGALIKLADTLGGARVGMTDLQHNAVVLPVADMSNATNVAGLKAQIAAIQPNLSNWAQPFHERLYNIAVYYEQTGSGAPIQYACQQNFDVLATPGYLNEKSPWSNPFTGVTPPAVSPSNQDGSAGPPYQDGWSDTLADWASYYYHLNLRPDLPAGQVTFPTGTHETNKNPHMTIYVYAPGAVPVIAGAPYNLNPATTNPFTYAPPGGSTQFPWVQPVTLDQSTVDDLWHAAVDGAGAFINSTDSYGGMNSIFTDALSRSGAAASVTVSSVNVISGNNFAYGTSYNSGNWTGDLVANPVNLTTGQPDPTQQLWGSGSAQTQLDQRTSANRYIATYNGSAGIPFQWASLSATMQSALNSPVTPPGTADGASVLAWLRGDRSQEGSNYRTRAHVLGDLIDAEPVVVNGPTYAYADSGYAAFASANANRQRMIYQGGNDGMLHAFNASTGAESWAYVPGLLFNMKLPSYPSTSTLVNLSMKTGFQHMYYVDATPTEGDVDFSYTYGNNLSSPPAPNWHSILVGGLGKGGRGFYALDVDGTTAASDSDASAKVLWEFPNSSTPASVAANVGYSFGKPIIAKLAGAGWVVIVSSGYNNGSDTGGDGQGHLYVLNAATGALIADLPTGAGSSSSPAGLAQISGYADNANVDNTVTYVYGGDLLGNVWRWDFTSGSVSKWSVTRLAALVDAAGNPQPVTEAPELANYSGTHMVFVGTGEYLGNSDIPGSSGANSHATQTQTMYGLVDNLSSTPLISPLRSSLVQQTFTTSGSTRLASNNTVNLTSKSGWYADFPDSGERSVTDPALVAGALVFTTLEPNDSNPCQPGGSSWFYVLDYRTGGVLDSGGSTLQPVASWSAESLGNTLASRPMVIKLPNGQLEALVRQSNANTTAVTIPVAPGTSGPRRVSWREIIYH